MRNTVILLSCVAFLAASACEESKRRSGNTTGTGGTTGTAGTTAQAGTTGQAGTTAAAGTTGEAGVNGAAGTTGDAGVNGAAGTTGDAGTNGGAGTTGTAGTTGDAGTNGAAGTGVAMVCNNSAVVTAGGTAEKCGAKTGWVASAMPKPANNYLGINNNQLQPEFAIDGSATTRYSSGATMADGFYYQVDLGSAKMISGIVVDAATDATDVANGYEVSVSTNGTDFTTKVASCLYNAAATETINFAATSARYVRYTAKGGPGLANGATSWLSIHEFNVICN